MAITAFSTDTYYMFKKSLPEFEELAAMESGWPHGGRLPFVAPDRRQSRSPSWGPSFQAITSASSGSPAAGQPLLRRRRPEGRTHHCCDELRRMAAGLCRLSERGKSAYINTKPATIIGVAPIGFYGDRIDTHPPKYFLPMN